MKPKSIIPSANERILPPDRYILSTTDRTGRITSVNDLFVEYSGYTADELIGQQHNITRHPDMPRAVFWLAWDLLAAGEEFNGYVKNLCKDGSFYWVFSNIRPIISDSGEMTGYRSVRRHARPQSVAKVAGLYAAMLAAETDAGPREAIQAGMTVLTGHLQGQGMGYEAMVAKL